MLNQLHMKVKDIERLSWPRQQSEIFPLVNLDLSMSSIASLESNTYVQPLSL